MGNQENANGVTDMRWGKKHGSRYWETDCDLSADGSIREKLPEIDGVQPES